MSRTNGLNYQKNKVRQMKNEVESLGTEVKKLLQSRHDQSVVSIYQNKCFQNLEAQLDALKEVNFHFSLLC